MIDTDEQPYRASIASFYTDEGGLQRIRWTDIGEAWRREDGMSFSVNLVAFPVGGQFIIRPDEPKPVTQPEPTA